MGQTVNSGLTQSEVISIQEATYITYKKGGMTGTDTLTVPAGKKWTVVYWNLYSYTAAVTALYMKSRPLHQTSVAGNQAGSNCKIMLAAAETIVFTAASTGDAFFVTYIEENA